MDFLNSHRFIKGLNTLIKNKKSFSTSLNDEKGEEKDGFQITNPMTKTIKKSTKLIISSEETEGIKKLYEQYNKISNLRNDIQKKISLFDITNIINEINKKFDEIINEMEKIKKNIVNNEIDKLLNKKNEILKNQLNNTINDFNKLKIYKNKCEINQLKKMNKIEKNEFLYNDINEILNNTNIILLTQPNILFDVNNNKMNKNINNFFNEIKINKFDYPYKIFINFNKIECFSFIIKFKCGEMGYNKSDPKSICDIFEISYAKNKKLFVLLNLRFITILTNTKHSI